MSSEPAKANSDEEEIPQQAIAAPVQCHSDCEDGEGDIICHFNFNKVVYSLLGLTFSAILSVLVIMIEKD